MKNKLLFVFILAVCTANLALADYVPDTVKAVKVTTAPEIDGTIDAVWDNAQFVDIIHWGDDPEPTATDYNGKFKVLWDNEFIYFLGVAVDETVTDMAGISAQAAPDWETDCFELYLEPSNAKMVDMTEMIQVRFSYANATNEDASSIVTNGWSEDGFTVANFVNAARVLTDDGWVAEAKLDIAALAASVSEEFVISDSSTLGFNVMAGDNDITPLRENVGSWIDGMDYNEADSSGILQLLPLGTGSAVKTIKQIKVGFSPNPIAQVLHISGTAKIESIEIVNLLGAKVLIAKNSNNMINVSKLNAGVYLVNFYSKGNIISTQKMLKN